MVADKRIDELDGSSLFHQAIFYLTEFRQSGMPSLLDVIKHLDIQIVATTLFI